ncbi:MAG: hypothetical protein CV090_07275, partial [Nitrospira sp. WS238]|nr:hypothetical protein [Nitrospira sp. WS238]
MLSMLLKPVRLLWITNRQILVVLAMGALFVFSQSQSWAEKPTTAEQPTLADGETLPQEVPSEPPPEETAASSEGED